MAYGAQTLQVAFSGLISIKIVEYPLKRNLCPIAMAGKRIMIMILLESVFLYKWRLDIY